MAVPYTGMIISTRESKACPGAGAAAGRIADQRRFPAPVSADMQTEEPEEETFGAVRCERQPDTRPGGPLADGDWAISQASVRRATGKDGTGDRFMSLCKSGQIQNCCHPNALMTLKEYLEDYASPQTRELGMKLIDREIENITNPKVKQTCYEHIHDIADGKRDFRF